MSESENRRFSHHVGFNDLYWDYAIRKSGLKNPAPWIRDRAYAEMMQDVQEQASKTSTAVEADSKGNISNTVVPTDFEAEWTEFGCQVDDFDLPFKEARQAFVDKHGDERTALDFIRRGVTSGVIRYPRGWIIHWFREWRRLDAEANGQ